MLSLQKSPSLPLPQPTLKDTSVPSSLEYDLKAFSYNAQLASIIPLLDLSAFLFSEYLLNSEGAPNTARGLAADVTQLLRVKKLHEVGTTFMSGQNSCSHAQFYDEETELEAATITNESSHSRQHLVLNLLAPFAISAACTRSSRPPRSHHDGFNHSHYLHLKPDSSVAPSFGTTSFYIVPYIVPQDNLLQTLARVDLDPLFSVLIVWALPLKQNALLILDGRHFHAL